MSFLDIVTVEGPDAATFMQGYVTVDLDGIQPLSANPMALTDIRGRVLANGWTYGSPDTVQLVVHASVTDIVEEHLKRYIVFAKCSTHRDSRRMDLENGNSSKDVVVNPLDCHLVAAGKGTANWRSITMNAHFPLVTSDISGMFIPQMLNLTEHDAVSFTKGCYLGQEVVARAQHRGAVKRRMHAYRTTDGSVKPGEKVAGEGRTSGVVIASFNDQALVVARDCVQSLQSEEGTKLTLAGTEG